MKKIGIIGLGNPLRKDDGIGIILLQKLIENKKKLPKNIEFVDGGTSGISLLHQLALFDIVYIIDAVDFGKNPGDLKLFRPEEIMKKYNLSISTHEIDFSKILEISEALKQKPEIFIFGIQPKNMDYGQTISSEIKEKIDVIAKTIISEINCVL